MGVDEVRTVTVLVMHPPPCASHVEAWMLEPRHLWLRLKRIEGDRTSRAV